MAEEEKSTAAGEGAKKRKSDADKSNQEDKQDDIAEIPLRGGPAGTQNAETIQHMSDMNYLYVKMENVLEQGQGQNSFAWGTRTQKKQTVSLAITKILRILHDAGLTAAASLGDDADVLADGYVATRSWE